MNDEQRSDGEKTYGQNAQQNAHSNVPLTEMPNATEITEERQQDNQKSDNTQENRKTRFGRIKNWIIKKAGEAHLADWANVGLAAVIAATTITYTVFAGLQWVAIRKSNKISHEALEAVQRAFVTYQGTSLVSMPKSLQPDDNAWMFRAMLENSGSTPAINRIQEFLINNTFQDEPTELEFIGPDEKYPMGEIGPKGNASLGPAIRDSSFIMGKFPFTIAAIASKDFKDFFRSRRIFVWGWVAYNDVFSDTQPHVTEFCQEVSGILATNSQPPGTPGPVKFQPQAMLKDCATHNCIDEHCPDYHIIVARIPK